MTPLRTLLIVLAATAAAVAGLRALPDGLPESAFAFRTLVASGDPVKVPADRVKAAVEGAIAGKNFFTANLEDVRRAVEAMPWVKSADVRRRWPGALEVRTHLHEVFGLYEDGRLVSTEGVLFSANLEEAGSAASLPELFGPPDAAPELVRVCRAFDELLEPLGARVTDLMLSDRGGWSFVMSGREMPPTRVNLGKVRDGQTPEERLEPLVEAYPLAAELFGGPPSSLDARYDRAFAAGMPDKALIAKHQREMAEGAGGQDPVLLPEDDN